MTVSWDVRFGDILIIASFVAGGLVYIFRVGTYAQTGLAMKKDIDDLKTELRKIADILTQLAVQKVRLDSQAERLNLIDQRVEDLRNGRGFIVQVPHHSGKKE